MYSLPTLMRLNAQPRPAAETETTRHCSFNGNASRGVIIHSAKHRNTLFLQAGDDASAFLRSYRARRSAGSRDRLIESYFA